MLSVKDKIKRAAKDVIETTKALNESITCKDDEIVETAEISIDEVKELYSEYRLELRQKQDEYMANLCNRIRRRAKAGGIEICVYSTDDECLTNEYMEKLEMYFGSKGFSTFYTGSLLKINWENAIKKVTL